MLKGIKAIAAMNVDLIYSDFGALPQLGEEVYSNSFSLQLGGGPVVLPVTLSRMGIPCELGTFFADDTLSKLAKQLLEDEGFKDYKNLYKGEKSPVVVTSVFSFPKDRSFLSHVDVEPLKFLDEQVEYEFLKGAKIAFAPQNENAARQLHEDGTVLVYDVGWTDGMKISDYEKILKYVDYFTPNDKEALQLTDTDNCAAALRALGEVVKTPIIKLGEQGCLALVNGRPLFVPAVEGLKVKDTTGAGDNFLAGFVYGVYNGCDLETCMKYGNVFGGYSTTEEGCYKARITKEIAERLI